MKEKKYKTIDLCAGIGGIRRGFELTKQFENVLSAEEATTLTSPYFFASVLLIDMLFTCSNIVVFEPLALKKQS